MDFVEFKDSDGLVYKIPLVDQQIVDLIVNKDIILLTNKQTIEKLSNETIAFLLYEYPSVVKHVHFLPYLRSQKIVSISPKLILTGQMSTIHMQSAIRSNPLLICDFLKKYVRDTVSAIKLIDINFLTEPFSPLPLDVIFSKDRVCFIEHKQDSNPSRLIEALHGISLYQIHRLYHRLSLRLFLQLEPGDGNRFRYPSDIYEKLKVVRKRFGISNLIVHR